MSNPAIDTETRVTVYKYADIPSTPIIENCTATKTVTTKENVVTSEKLQINIYTPYFLSLDISLDQFDSVIEALNYIKNNMPQ